jgi:hypothetical protein
MDQTQECTLSEDAETILLVTFITGQWKRIVQAPFDDLAHPMTSHIDQVEKSLPGMTQHH